MDEEPNVDDPYTDCYSHSDLISIPNGRTGSLDEHLICEHDREEEAETKTYMRRTINSEAAPRAR